MTDTTTIMRQDSLFDDEPEISVTLAGFVPLANKISDAAATYIAKVDKALADDKHPILGASAFALQETIGTAKLAVKLADDINRRLRRQDGYTVTVHAPDTGEDA